MATAAQAAGVGGGQQPVAGMTVAQLEARFETLAPQASSLLAQLTRLHAQIDPEPAAPPVPSGMSPDAVRARSWARRRVTLGLEPLRPRAPLPKAERDAIVAQIRTLTGQYVPIQEERTAIVEELARRKRKSYIRNRVAGMSKDDVDVFLAVLKEVA